MRLSILALAVCSAAGAQTLTEQYKATADRLIDAALADTEGYRRLTYLCDRIGHRLAGSAGLEKAIAWSAEQMKAAGLSNVRVIPVKVPKWVRGAESARMLAPHDRPMKMLGLGMSVGTPPGGITAETVAVSSFEELAKLGREKVQGKIVVYNNPYQGYGLSVQYRSAGASRAAALGAVAALVRAVTPLAMQTPHTGAMNYAADQPKIPAASITPEDAGLIQRLYQAGVPVKVRLEMSARMEPDADSGERDRRASGPREAGGGRSDRRAHRLVGRRTGRAGRWRGSIMACLQAVALMKKLGIQPRRTIRVVFWTNEENGGRGGVGYREWVGDAVKNHVAAIEMDGGAEAPRGYGAGVDAASMEPLKQIAKLLERVGAGEITPGGGGADITPLVRDGVPGLSERTAGTHYFDWHHTEADTLDKVDPEEFRKERCLFAVMSYGLAEMPGRMACRERQWRAAGAVIFTTGRHGGKSPLGEKRTAYPVHDRRSSAPHTALVVSNSSEKSTGCENCS